MSDTGPIVRVAPQVERWQRLIAGAKPVSDSQRKFRTQLGLPVEQGKPLILSGHQAEFWHAGILAKFFALQVAAQSLGAHGAWLIVDQDEAGFHELAYPTVNERGDAERRVARLGPKPPEGAAVASCSAFDPGPTPIMDAGRVLDSVREGVERIFDALRTHCGESTAGRQIAAATAELLMPCIGGQRLAYATDISRTEFFAELVDRMRAKPHDMARTYNDAVAAHPGAGVAPLGAEGARAELPIWRLSDGQPRARVWSDDPCLDELTNFAPRALLMTGMLRAEGCELFIHGAGGASYDAITEEWFAAWLGRELAPTVMVSADLLLPLPGADVSPTEVAAAQWRAHSARHNPTAIGEPALHAEKMRLVAKANDARGTPRGLTEYRALHSWLNQYRDSKAAQLADLQSRATELVDRAAATDVARDRTWPFPLHDNRAIGELRAAIASTWTDQWLTPPSGATDTLSRSV